MGRSTAPATASIRPGLQGPWRCVSGEGFCTQDCMLWLRLRPPFVEVEGLPLRVGGYHHTIASRESVAVTDEAGTPKGQTSRVDRKLLTDVLNHIRPPSTGLMERGRGRGRGGWRGGRSSRPPKQQHHVEVQGGQRPSTRRRGQGEGHHQQQEQEQGSGQSSRRRRRRHQGRPVDADAHHATVAASSFLLAPIACRDAVRMCVFVTCVSTSHT